MSCLIRRLSFSPRQGRDQIRGERADDLERAIAAFKAALTVTAPEAFPEGWTSI
ncbi:MAG: hypothetical protein WBG11_16305 [Methylocella sp.]